MIVCWPLCVIVIPFYFSERRRESNHDQNGCVYSDSDVESEVDVTGLQDEKHANEGQIKPDPVKEERCTSCGKSCSHGDEEDPIFQQFLRDMESDFVTPTEEQKKLLRYVSDWKH